MSRLASLFLDNAPKSETLKAVPGPIAEEANPAYRVLFVDDEPSVLKAMRRIFHRKTTAS